MVGHAERYEVLRAAAVAAPAVSASRDGLVVLLRQGVAAWMDAGAMDTTDAQRGPTPCALVG
jgi:hypothetical protein